GARLSEADRTQLAGLLTEAVHRAEHRLREQLRPLVAETLRQVGLAPQNVAEQVALHKLTEELLDQVAERGYLNMGQLRDAVSRNQLKLPDLAGPGEFLRGDRLLRANARLAEQLDGIYRRGEVYLRELQRLSSLAFGTPPGRFLTRYLALPFGGAAIISLGLYYLIEEISKGLQFLDASLPTIHVKLLMSPVTIGLLGVFLFLLLHVPRFRAAVGRGLKQVYRGARAVLVDLPAYLLELPLVQRVLRSRALRFSYHYLFKPLAFAVPVGLFLRTRETAVVPPAEGGFMAFVAANLVLNSRVGRDLEEACIDGLVTTWQRVRADILPGLFRLVMDFFKWLLEGVDRLLYAVDEWLRFRAGDSRLSLMAKAVLGPFWGAVTYVVRIVVNLLIEPQVNPIKHFPVVTVSHKLLLPLIPALGSVLAAQMDKELAYTAATLIIGAIPGIFGFLVWELKENWRLYRANRPAALEPVVIGHHGETMARLLRPGFHSGTLPKLYARLRRAERRALRTGQRKAPRKYRDALHELEGLVRHFVERDFLAILERSKTWGGRPIEVRGVALASNRVRVELGGPAPAAPGLVITIEEQSGWLLAGVAAPGWLGELSGERRQVLRAALAGLYKFAGVDLVREQIEACLGPGQVVYDVADEGLVVWAGPSGTVEAVYDLDAGPRMEPRIMSGPTAAALPALPAEPLRFDRVLVLWETWVDVWEQDQAGKEPPESLLEGVCLLPRTPPGR
ncbi:MAG TPA: hypothetical protein VNK04_10275, partial [Gemmataceae bacterium]|nr:hypothetical protein [Gemmataceae bacterium]